MWTLAVLFALLLLAARRVQPLAPQRDVSGFLARIEPFEQAIRRATDGTWGPVVDPDVVRAIIWQESRGDPNAVRLERTGQVARGLMQVTEPAARDVGFAGGGEVLLNPSLNIMYGTMYLYKQFEDFGGTPAWPQSAYDAIAAYNAGPTTVRKWKERQEPYANQDYVDSVVAFWRALKQVA